MPVTIGGSLSFCGRNLSSEDLALIRETIRDFPGLSLTELANTLCELLDWRRPNGALKTRESFDFLQELHSRGWLPALPSIRGVSRSRPRSCKIDRSSDPQEPLTGPLQVVLPLQLKLIDNQADRQLFQQFIQRYHYLGYKVPYGAQLRYFVLCPKYSKRILACLLFTSAAWKMAARDTWIGWNDTARQANLPLIVNNSRFLILPWIQIPNLASHIFSLVVRRLARDWCAHFKVQPLLLETLVDISRFSGTCYRAANWINVGLTKGRGRMDRYHKAEGLAPKQIFLYPLLPKARQLLSQNPKEYSREFDR
jgi:hypothetical protein